MKKTLLKLAPIVSFIILIGVFWQPLYKTFAAAIPVSVATFQTSLQASITSSDTSMTLVNGTDKAGHSLSGYTCFNIDEGTSIEEFVCGTASGTSITSLIRGIDPVDGDLSVTALKKAHRRGASVKITNYPSLGILSRILNGNETLPNPITYGNGIGPVNASDLADKEYVLSVVSGGTVSFEKVTVTGVAGETISAGNVVYLKQSDGRWWKADADLTATIDTVQMGIAQGSGTAGSSITGGVLIRGVDINNTGTAGAYAYVSNTAGSVATSAGTNTKIIGQFVPSSAGLYFDPNYYTTITSVQAGALTGGGAFGTPSSSNKFITQDYNASSTGLPTVQRFTAQSTSKGDTTTRFDITNPAGTTFRYTWDTTGTDPSITALTMPVGIPILIESSVMSAANTGYFVVTGSGANYFEVSNASGVAENDKTLANGYLKTITAQTYTKPAGLKYAIVEVQGAGSAGQGTTVNGNNLRQGGASGGYIKSIIPAATIGTSQTLYVGPGGVGVNIDNALKYQGGPALFGSILTANGGILGGATGGTVSTSGGTTIFSAAGIPGEVNISASSNGRSGRGADSWLGKGGTAVTADSSGIAGYGYGSGGSGAAADSSAPANAGGNGADAIIIVSEFYN